MVLVIVVPSALLSQRYLIKYRNLELEEYRIVGDYLSQQARGGSALVGRPNYDYYTHEVHLVRRYDNATLSTVQYVVYCDRIEGDQWPEFSEEYIKSFGFTLVWHQSSPDIKIYGLDEN